MAKTVYIITLGCAKNLVDTEVMTGYLVSSGYLLTESPDLADIILINTCSFIESACSEADDVISSAVEWKQAGENRQIAVAGCLPQRFSDELAEKYPEVDFFIYLDDVPRIAEILAASGAPAQATENQAVPDKPAIPSYLYDENEPRLQLTPQNYAYVKIAEGCNHNCLFCTIPSIRGRRRSRSQDSVVEEIRMLLANGAREINLIAQDTTAYGRDLAEKPDIVELLRKCDSLEGDFWLRLLYTHPAHFTDELIDFFRNSEHLVPYVDMPLQHISDPVLQRMGRGKPDSSELKRLLARIREQIPDITLRTTFLTGYPGETEADFKALLELVRDFRFERLGVFAFSPEAGTPAAEMKDEFVAPEIAEARRNALMEEQQRISLENNRQLVDETPTVLTESEGEEENSFAGRTRGDAPEVDNRIIFTGPPDTLETGFVKVKIDSADPYDLFGYVV